MSKASRWRWAKRIFYILGFIAQEEAEKEMDEKSKEDKPDIAKPHGPVNAPRRKQRGI